MRSRVYIDTCGLGRGLFAARDFGRGELIVVLRGPRYERGDPIHLRPEGANLLQTGRKTYIMLAPPGVFANHSCNPNAGIVGNRRLVAIEAISAGAEICYDYSTTMDEDYWTMECHCGDARCRGRVTDFRHLPGAVRERYLQLGIVQRFIARRCRG